MARGSLSADPVGFALGETFDRADALLIYFRLVISFCLADLPDLQKFHFELMHCSLDFQFVI